MTHHTKIRHTIFAALIALTHLGSAFAETDLAPIEAGQEESDWSAADSFLLSGDHRRVEASAARYECERCCCCSPARDKAKSEENVPNSTPLKSPFSLMLFNNNFSYLNEPGAKRNKYYEWFKERHCGPFELSFGGQVRHQFKNEDKRSLFLGAPTNPGADAYQLIRTRAYLDGWYEDRFRAYIEYLDAASPDQTLPELAIDLDRSDLLNVFAEAKLHEWDNGSVSSVRLGRQQLLDGEQRLVSPLFWANAPRTFEGMKLMSSGGEKWDTHLFWVRPVNAFYYTRFLPYSYDQPAEGTWFAGVVGNSKGSEKLKLMPYLYGLRIEDALPGPATGMGHRLYSGNPDNLVWTAGNRFHGKVDQWLYDVEGALQVGRSDNQDVVAGMMTAGVGYSYPDLPWSPILWGWFDWASGDTDPNDGTINTFNQLYPLAHKYFGFTDLVARQNVYDANFQIMLYPTRKLHFLIWTHFMWLAEPRDGLYNAAGIVSFQDPTGQSGQHIGNEVDLLLRYTFSPGFNFEISYNQFWSGNFIRNQGGQDQAYLVYTEFNFHF